MARSWPRVHRGRRRPLPGALIEIAWCCSPSRWSSTPLRGAHLETETGRSRRPAPRDSVPAPCGSAREARHHPRWISTIVVCCLCGLSVAIALVPLAFVLFFVVSAGVRALNGRFFTALRGAVGETGGGFANAIVGTRVLVGIGAAFAVPLGASHQRLNLPRGVSGDQGSQPCPPRPTRSMACRRSSSGSRLLHRGDALPAVQVPWPGHRPRHHDDSDRHAHTEELIKLVPPALREGSLALGALAAGRR